MNKALVLLFAVFSFVATNGYSQEGVSRSSSIVTISGEQFYVHMVSTGETLYSLSKLYNVDIRSIEDNNPQVVEGLQQGQVIKIPVVKEDSGEKLTNRQRNRLFEVHIVNHGETLYSISRRYGVAVNTLLEDNAGLDPAHLSIGQKLNVRKKSMGDASAEQIETQMEDYKDALNSVSTEQQYHVVEKGETIYRLSQKYGITEQELRDANDLSDGLKEGALITIPVKPETQTVIVGPVEENADSVFTDTYRNPDSLEMLSVRPLEAYENPNVALFLPLKGDNDQSNKHFLEFYRGFLIGLEHLKKEGVNARVALYNTGRSVRNIYEIVNSGEFSGTNLIVGPVYEGDLHPVIEYAERNSVPIVSPLASLQTESSPMLYQMAPASENKYDKLKELLAQDRNIIYISTRSADEEMEKEIRPLLPQGYKHVDFSGNVRTQNFSQYFDRTRENLVFISCTSEVTVDQIMASLSSMQNNIAARSIGNVKIQVVGNPRWSRFRNNVDRNLYFKLNLTYITTYHADRSNEKVLGFDNHYINSFGALPTLYSYRGFDVAKLFVGSLKSQGDGTLTTRLNEKADDLLEVPYKFERKERGGTNVNTQWAMVCYKDDYTIEVR